ncbi:hypothetical protein RA27_18275 [Ruegeria sp. ANG-R]|uniref:CPBP family intramembrane glutamic endopeptidase n=1 Tax=Ruegeria sp. ANG-R TaxID=1577903 RepID=UPI00057FB145|nr:CPBP family intramembrane glutamic endopeptidase [Ruegeria sp. ANG-R]KIC38839.1 hypothetical protein RA27_18275 [Ruegeria sp. ANG-R]
MSIFTKKQIAALLTAALYLVLVIGAAHIDTQRHPGADMTQTLLRIWWVYPVAAVVITVFMRRYFTWAEVGFRKLNWRQMGWMLPVILILGAVWVSLIVQASGAALTQGQWMTLATLAVLTICVGYSEEILFRGMILHSFLETRGKLVAVLVSGVLFGLAHSSNAFAGLLPLGGALGQAATAMLFGLLFGLLMLRINCIVPLMIYHALWDLSLSSTTVMTTNPVQAYQVITAIPMELVLTVILMVLLIRETRRE